MHKASYATTFYFRLIPLKNKFSVDFPSSPVPADHAVQAGKVLCISGHQIGKFRVVVHPSLVMHFFDLFYMSFLPYMKELLDLVQDIIRIRDVILHYPLL